MDDKQQIKLIDAVENIVKSFYFKIFRQPRANGKPWIDMNMLNSEDISNLYTMLSGLFVNRRISETELMNLLNLNSNEQIQEFLNTDSDKFFYIENSLEAQKNYHWLWVSYWHQRHGIKRIPGGVLNTNLFSDELRANVDNIKDSLWQLYIDLTALFEKEGFSTINAFLTSNRVKRRPICEIRFDTESDLQLEDEANHFLPIPSRVTDELLPNSKIKDYVEEAVAIKIEDTDNWKGNQDWIAYIHKVYGEMKEIRKNLNKDGATYTHKEYITNYFRRYQPDFQDYSKFWEQCVIFIQALLIFKDYSEGEHNNYGLKNFYTFFLETERSLVSVVSIDTEEFLPDLVKRLFKEFVYSLLLPINVYDSEILINNIVWQRVAGYLTHSLTAPISKPKQLANVLLTEFKGNQFIEWNKPIPEMDVTLEELCKEIITMAEYGEDLIQFFLNWQNLLEQGDLKPTNIPDLLEKTYQIARKTLESWPAYSAHRSKAQVKVEIPKEGPTISIHQVGAKLVFSNLIKNAMYHSSSDIESVRVWFENTIDTLHVCIENYGEITDPRIRTWVLSVSNKETQIDSIDVGGDRTIGKSSPTAHVLGLEIVYQVCEKLGWYRPQYKPKDGKTRFDVLIPIQ